jgi:quinol-cytochrome oxidoreductase complex cytochrome b subunit
LILFVFLHFLRVVLTGGFQPLRHVNWFFGLLLLINSLAAGFTGYLLPWDQLAYWAITICTGMLACFPWLEESLQQLFQSGDEIGPVTLQLFYTFQTAVLPGGMIVLLALHFWYIRRS